MAAQMGKGISRAVLFGAIALGALLLLLPVQESRPAEAASKGGLLAGSRLRPKLSRRCRRHSAGPSVRSEDPHQTQPADPAAGDEADATDETNPLGANAACYVCHIPFVKEELATVHLKAKVTCIKCHGLSAAHANDEDIGATLPDVVFRRDQIDALCGECHQGHDVPAREVTARYVQRHLPAKPAPVCTDCHGKHKIEPPELAE